MKEIKKLAAQGDVLIIRRSKLPTDAKSEMQSGRAVVAHSETGHHHVAEPAKGGEVALFSSSNPLVSYLRVRGTYADVVHERPWDTHETLRLLNDGQEEVYWEIRRQREHSPEGWRRVED